MFMVRGVARVGEKHILLTNSGHQFLTVEQRLSYTPKGNYMFKPRAV